MQAQSFSALYTSTGEGDGANPRVGLTGQSGNLYAAASADDAGDGAVFRLTNQNSGLGIQTGVSNSTLSGHYAIVLNGFKNGSPFILVAALIADGSGNITVGKLDVNYGQGEPNDSTQCRGNRNCPIAETVQSPGSVYDLSGGNGLGTMTLSTLDYFGSPHTYKFSISVSGNACVPDPSRSACGRLIERDPSDPQIYGSGVIKVQDSDYFSIGSFFPGNFALLATGEDPSGKRYAAVGALGTNPGTRVDVDCNANGWHLPYCPLTVNDNGHTATSTSRGSFSADLDPNIGRGNFLTLGFPGDPNGYCTGIGTTFPCSYAYYVINRQEMVLISADPLSKPANMAIWMANRQAANTWGVSSINGVTVVELSAANSNTADVSAGLFSANGSGRATFSSDENNGGVVSRQTSSGTYAVDPTGRNTGKVTLNGFSQFTSGTAALYLYSGNTGYLLGNDPEVTAGVMEPQTGSPYSNASVKGNLVGSTEWPAVSGVTNSVTSLFANGGGTLVGTQYTSGPSGPGGPGNLGLTYHVDLTGRAVVLRNGSQFGFLYVVGADKFVLLPTGSSPALNVFISGQPD